MIAFQNGYVEVMNTLLQHGASVDHQKKVHVKFMSLLCANTPTVLMKGTKVLTLGAGH